MLPATARGTENLRNARVQTMLIPEHKHGIREFCTTKKHLLRLTSGLLLMWKGCGVLLNMTIDQERFSGSHIFGKKPRRKFRRPD